MSKPVKGSEIREAFLSYFEKQGHARVASSKLIPENDPSLLFTNAGMVHFKDVFLGIEKRPYTRATTCQKSVRAGGKHNDLENVGFTERHHTFFEMLGNFSFGDYFKKDAIHFAWEFVTKDLGLPKDKLRVSVYKDDQESADIWHKQEGVPLDRIVRFDEDNFWAMGDTGPCGPCSEIFWDQGKDVDGERWLEFWNVVFMQYDRQKDGTLVPLKKPSVDTGMGLERMATVMQGVQSNYEVDLLAELVRFTHSSFENKLKKKIDLQSRENLCAIRVIVDHLRSTSFLIADGVQPSNEGRGYVLRRILRRAVRFGHKLGAHNPFLGELYPALLNSLGDVYPELKVREPIIREVLKQEEERFFETLDRGLEILEEALKKSNSKSLPAEAVFQLYDTFGFPFDLTQLIARERGLSVDMQKVEVLLSKQQELSRAHWKGSGAETLPPQVREWKSALSTKATFYENSESQSKVLAFYKSEGNTSWVAIDPCPFYAESGGQVGDSGQLIDAKGNVLKVSTCKKVGDSTLALRIEGTSSLSVGDSIKALVDDTRRSKIRSNHTATHLLHAALRETLGDHVHQAGSFLDESRVRFDFSHGNALSEAELQKIEQWVNDQIEADQAVSIASKSYKEALQEGAMALFGEKYGDTVRMVSIGQGSYVKAVSLELCGGLHVQRTSQIQRFKILREEGVAAGTRRIEACSGEALVRYLLEKETTLDQAALTLQVPAAQVPVRLSKLLQEKSDLEKKIKELEKKLASGSASSGNSLETNFKGKKIIIHMMEDVSVNSLREVADQLRNKTADAAHVLVSGLNLIVTADPKLSFHSGAFLKEFVGHWKGRGGGNEKTAQGAFQEKVSLDEIQNWFKSHAS